MPAYRFCRTDDMPLLVAAYNRCRGARSPDRPPLDLDRLKRWIRELNLWCSSCMVASGHAGVIGVLLGCKRPEETLILDLAVHPDHVRHGHGRHLLDSLGRKLGILGPPRIVAELPADNAAGAAFLEACGYRGEETFVDWALEEAPAGRPPEGEMMATPVSVDDLDDAGLLTSSGAASWFRAAATLRNRRRVLEGLAVASGSGLEAYILVLPSRGDRAARIGALGESAGARGAAALDLLVAAAVRRHGRLVLPRAGTGDPPAARLAAWGFRPGPRYRRWAAEAVAG